MKLRRKGSYALLLLQCNTSDSHFSHSWKIRNLIMLLKLGKYLNNPRSYGLFSLMRNLFTIFEYSRAFDYVSKAVLLHNVNWYVHYHYTETLQFYLSNTVPNHIWGGVSTERQIIVIVSQGSVLRPLLYCPLLTEVLFSSFYKELEAVKIQQTGQEHYQQ